MKQAVKWSLGLFMGILAIGAIALLAIKYFDVLMKIFDDIRDQISAKRSHLLSDACCDCCNDLDEEDI